MIDPQALAGAAPATHTADGVRMVLGAAALVLVLDAGDRPRGNAVAGADTVHLAGPIPEPFADALDSDLPVRVLVADGADLVDLGEASLGMLASSGDVVTEVELRLHQYLSEEVLDRVRPVSPAPNPAGTDWVELVRDGESRAAALAAFLDGWFGPEGGPAPASLPVALGEVLRRAVAHPAVLGHQNELRTEPAPQEDGTVWFASENQGVWTLAYRPDAPDPEVLLELDDDPEPEVEPVSGQLLAFELFETCFAEEGFGAMGELDADEVAEAVSGLRAVPLGPIGWLGGAARFHAGPDLVVVVSPAPEPGAPSFVTAGARSRAALAPLATFDWDHFEG